MLRSREIARALLIVLSCGTVALLQFAHFQFSLLVNSTLDGIFRLRSGASLLDAQMTLVSSTGLASVAPLVASTVIVALFPTASWARALIACLATLYYSLNAFLLLYRLVRRFPFDIYLVWYNRNEVWPTLSALSDDFHMLVVLAAAILALHFYGLLVIYRLAAERIRVTVAGAFAALALCVATQGLAGNEIVRGITPLLAQKSDGHLLYDEFYERSLASNKANAGALPKEGGGESLIVIHLESLNSRLVDERITPNLIAIAKKRGILFPAIQSTTVLTIRAQETILCSVLPALGPATASSSALSNGLVCLPRVLKNLGFRTFYFHSHPDIHFANSDLFMKWIGFDERHAADIMKPGDQQLRWGYPEPVFYQRVFEHLERFKGQKLFAYVVVNTTNHFPFYDEEKRRAFPELAKKVPYREPMNVRERLTSTTYLQDVFLGEMHEKWFKRYMENTNMLVLGDHSWPIGIHFNDASSDHGAYQDNFVTSLAFLPAAKNRNAFAIGKRVESLYSQLDIVPTILELYGIEGLKYHGRSFVSELRSRYQRPGGQRCLVSVQPFSGKSISVIDFPIKHLFHLSRNRYATFNLEKDPDEMSPLNDTTIDAVALKELKRCLDSVERNAR